RLVDAIADHGFKHTVLVGGVSPGKPALDAGMAPVGFAIFPGNHAHDFLAFHFGLEGATDTAIGAGGDDGVLGLAHHDDRLFGQGGSGAGLHASAAGHTIAFQEGVVLPGHDTRVETLALHREGKSALYFVA